VLLSELRQLFETNGHHVNHRDEVDAAGAAWYCGLAVGTLANKRMRNAKVQGPPYVDYRSGVRYPIVGLANWQEQRLRSAA